MGKHLRAQRLGVVVGDDKPHIGSRPAVQHGVFARAGDYHVAAQPQQRLKRHNKRQIGAALLKHPKVLIFDDSTSAVDTATESGIRRALAELGNVTKLIIAQRISSVQSADIIVILDETVDGYNLLAAPIEFTLQKDECRINNTVQENMVTGTPASGYTVSLTINNRKGFTLPHTGADAPSLWLLIGQPLLVAGLLVLVFRYNRKGGKRS